MVVHSTLLRFLSLRNNLARQLQWEEDGLGASEVGVTAAVVEDVVVLGALFLGSHIGVM